LNYQDPDFAEEGQRGLEMAALGLQPEVGMLGLMNQQRISPGYLRRQERYSRCCSMLILEMLTPGERLSAAFLKARKTRDPVRLRPRA